MAAPKSPLIEAALDLAWSHWGALGVRGVVRPPSTAVDPEALLYLTAAVVEHDPRLHDEVADWWSRYHERVSQSRIKGLAAQFGESIELFQLDLDLRSGGDVSGKSHLDGLGTAARALLRMRCAFGVNARAEVLLEMLTRPGELMTALELSELGYNKRTIALVLDDLRMAGLATAVREGNRTRYRLTDATGLANVLGPIPTAPGRWHLRLPILASFVKLARRIRGKSAVSQAVAARKELDRISPQLLAVAPSATPPAATAETYWRRLEPWLVETLLSEPNEANRALTGMIEGLWVPRGHGARRPERFGSAILPSLGWRSDHDDVFSCLDLVQVPMVKPANDWEWVVLSTAATNVYDHTIGLDRGDPWTFVTWAFGAPRTYFATYKEPIAHGELTQAYGGDAAYRAREDVPAVQLQLRRVDAD